MDKIVELALIQYLHKKDLAPKATGEGCPFICCKKVGGKILESLEDDPRSGGSVTVVTPEIVTKVYDMVMGDRRVTETYTAIAVGISQERVHSILTEDLDMRKISALWVSRLLTVDQKHTRQYIAC